MAAKNNSDLLDLREIGNIFFESATEGMIVTNKEGIICVANPAMAKMFGYNKQELVGKKVEELMPANNRRKHLSHRKTYMKHPSKRSMGIGKDLIGQRKNGSQFPVEISLNHFEIGSKKMVIAMVTDITKRETISGLLIK